MKAELLQTFVAGARSVPVLATRADGSLMTGGLDGHLRRWDTTHWIELSALDAHGRGVRDLDLDPSVEGLMASVGGDRTLRVWRQRDGRPLFAASRRASARLSPAGVAAVSSRGRICMHSRAPGGEERRLPRLDDRVTCVGWTPDARSLLAGSTGAVYRLRVDDGAEEFRRPFGAGPVTALDVGPEGQGFVAVAPDATIGRWSVDGDLRWQVEPDGAQPVSVRISPDGRWVAQSMAYLVQIRDLSDGRLACEIKYRLKGVFGLAWSADSTRVMSSGADGRVRVWALTPG